MRTLPGTWKASLHQLLSQLIGESGRAARIAIVGIGNPLRSDDAAGILIARALLRQEYAANSKQFIILDAGHAPENSTAELRRFQPDLVVFIDAAEMGEQPGTIRWVAEEDIDGMSASTHSLPLSMLTCYLQLELSCKVILLGIQAASNEVGQAISAEVLQAVNEVVQGFDEAIHDCVSAQPFMITEGEKAIRPAW